jgi:hypothetical protein
VRIEIEVEEAAATELQEYARWVELSSALGTPNALATTVEFALRDLFRRDRLWQERRRNGTESQPAPALAVPKVPVPSLSLPPQGPTPRTPSVATSAPTSR